MFLAKPHINPQFKGSNLFFNWFLLTIYADKPTLNQLSWKLKFGNKCTKNNTCIVLLPVSDSMLLKGLVAYLYIKKKFCRLEKMKNIWKRWNRTKKQLKKGQPRKGPRGKRDLWLQVICYVCMIIYIKRGKWGYIFTLSVDSFGKRFVWLILNR